MYTILISVDSERAEIKIEHDTDPVVQLPRTRLLISPGCLSLSPAATSHGDCFDPSRSLSPGIAKKRKTVLDAVGDLMI